MSERPAGKGTRTQQHEIVIDAPDEAVWKAISRWRGADAVVRRGGQRRAGRRRHDRRVVGRRREGARPNRRMGAEPEAAITLMPFEMGAAKYDGTTPMVDEYTIERRDGKTVLRLVRSGIPNTPEWDGFYDGTDSGWSRSSARCATTSNTTPAGRGRQSRSSARGAARRRRAPRAASGGAAATDRAEDARRRRRVLEMRHSPARRRTAAWHDVVRGANTSRIRCCRSTERRRPKGGNDPHEMQPWSSRRWGVERERARPHTRSQPQGWSSGTCLMA